MDKLPVEKRAEVGKMSTERLRIRLVKAMDLGDLLNLYAEFLLKPTAPVEAAGGKATGGGLSEEEIAWRREELALQRQKLSGR